MNASPALDCVRLFFITLTVAIRPPLSFQQFRQSCADLCVLLFHFRKACHAHPAHVAEHRELIEVAPDGLLLTEHVIQSVYDHDLSAKAGFCHVVGEGHIRLLCLAVYGGEVFLADAYTHFLVFQK